MHEITARLFAGGCARAAHFPLPLYRFYRFSPLSLFLSFTNG